MDIKDVRTGMPVITGLRMGTVDEGRSWDGYDYYAHIIWQNGLHTYANVRNMNPYRKPKTI